MLNRKDTVALHKQNGEIIEGIKSLVQTKLIFIDDSKLPIEEGDHFIRILPNGLTEKYLVLDRGFYDSGAFKAHYQCKVQKVTSRELEQSKQVIYNLNGVNSRVNNNSTDHSINIVDMSTNALFDELRKVINDKIDNDEVKNELRILIEEMESSQGTGEFNKLYTKLITTAANHLTILTPFIPALSQMIQA